ncbi:hypothetical protein D9M72_300940 [compost metagenome]
MYPAGQEIDGCAEGQQHRGPAQCPVVVNPQFLSGLAKPDVENLGAGFGDVLGDPH